MTAMCGSLRYMAPEVALSQKYNHRSEAYSFAVVVWEMLALKRPYEGVTQATYADIICGADGRRPPLDKKWPEELRNILTRCWAPDFTKRPDFSEVVHVMMSIVAQVERERNRHAAGLLPRDFNWDRNSRIDDDARSVKSEGAHSVKSAP